MHEPTFEILLDDTTLRGSWTLPEGPGPHPLVVWLHDFGSNRSESRGLFVTGARHLAACGFASLRFDFRGFGESGGQSADSTISTMVRDVEAVLAHASHNPSVMGSCVTLLGFGLGGAIASQLAQHPAVSAMVMWSPIVFPVPIFARLGLYAAHPEIQRQGWMDAGGFRVGRTFLKELVDLDPLAALCEWNKPLLVLWGEDDTVATSENAAALVEERPGAEGHACPLADHHFGTLKARSWLSEHTTTWLRQARAIAEQAEATD
ncbi:MAG: alpha/beta fold hydrolase [Candidatus Sericytochromatia bacterium]|nr:alpha/beta fold hydrolase [Candidatus Sericytochromatia bacterium]